MTKLIKIVEYVLKMVNIRNFLKPDIIQIQIASVHLKTVTSNPLHHVLYPSRGPFHKLEHHFWHFKCLVQTLAFRVYEMELLEVVVATPLM